MPSISASAESPLSSCNFSAGSASSISPTFFAESVSFISLVSAFPLSFFEHNSSSYTLLILTILTNHIISL